MHWLRPVFKNIVEPPNESNHSSTQCIEYESCIATAFVSQQSTHKGSVPSFFVTGKMSYDHSDLVGSLTFMASIRLFSGSLDSSTFSIGILWGWKKGSAVGHIKFEMVLHRFHWNKTAISYALKAFEHGKNFLRYSEYSSAVFSSSFHSVFEFSSEFVIALSQSTCLSRCSDSL